MTRSKKRISVGVIGLGKMGLLHASILSVLPNVDVTALCDKSWLLRKFSKNLLDIPLITGKISELQPLDLDAVFVTTPIPSHYSIINDICERGIARSLFVEKTLSNNYNRSKELTELVENRGILTMVGYMKRFSVTFKKAKELLNQRVLGELLSFDAYAYSSDFSEVKAGSSVSAARGGVVEDLGSHIVDIALWFFEDLTVRNAETRSIISANTVDSAEFDVVCPDDVEGKFRVSWVEKGYRMPEFGLEIHGNKGRMLVDDTELRLELSNNNPIHYYRQDLFDNVSFLLGDPEYYREDEYFINSISQSKPPEISFRSAARVDLILDKVANKLE